MRLRLARLRYRFLGLFSDVRHLRTMEDGYRAAARELSTRNFTLTRENETLTSRLDEAERGLAVMTTARMNLEREMDVVRGQLSAVTEISAARCLDLQKMVDFYTLEIRGRMVFGVAPERTKPPESASPDPPRAVRAGQAIHGLVSEYHERLARGEVQPIPTITPVTEFSKESVAS